MPHWPRSVWIALPAICLVTWLAYAPGLSGGFLFDDLVNLPALGAMGPVDDWPTFWRYITSGTADPTGRPLALLSFLLDARNWPADPQPFLRTNLLVHLLNGILLFLLLRSIGRTESPKRAETWAALLGSGLWLLHPLLVSTTLYIVQREALLAGTFVLLGLLAYLRGRRLYADGACRAGIAWMLSGIGLGTALAMLCKANGALLPILAWVLEATVLRSRRSDAGLRRWRLALIWLPSLALLGWLVSQLRDFATPLDMRPWTLGQRLLTEPRVLLDYLQLLLVPRALSTGLFNDGYAVSKGLFDPPSTALAIGLILALAATAFALRRRAAAWSAALLFFFAGHLLESSVIPLELYYEHRNYVAAMLLFWPPSLALCHWNRLSLPLRSVAGVSLLVLFAVVTHQRAVLWGQPALMAKIWAHTNPASPRAQAAAAMAEIASGEPDHAKARLGPLLERKPHELQLVLNYVDAACAGGGLSPSEIAAASSAFEHAQEGQQLAWHWLGSAIDRASGRRCTGLDLSVVETWLHAARSNPAMQRAGTRQDLEMLAGRVALAKGDATMALLHFDRSLAIHPTPDAAAQQAALLASAGYARHALAHLDHYDRIGGRSVGVSGWHMRRLHDLVLESQGYWAHELGLLRATLNKDIARRPADFPDASPHTTR